MTTDFWFSIGSTYTYLSVMRIDAAACQAGLTFRWRPFDVRSIMVEMNNIPFSTKPVKAQYMWRDIERRTALYGLPWSAIPPYPLKHLSIPNRIALLGAQEGWCPQYVKAAYRRWFVGGHDASMEPAISDTLAEIGQDATRIIAWASSEEGKQALQHETDTARQLGIFGSPTFAAGSELFWGDDRMDDAIRWCRHGTLEPAGKN
jgi:2-hydroxychromene-2-carboxylate isomerase